MRGDWGEEGEEMKINLEVDSDHCPADCLPCGQRTKGLTVLDHSDVLVSCVEFLIM